MVVPLFSVAVVAFIVCFLPSNNIAAPTNNSSITSDGATNVSTSESSRRSTSESVTSSPTDSPSPSTDDPLDGSESEKRHSQQYKTLTNSEKLAKVTELVKVFKLQDCAGRVLCDLNCQPVAFGSDGKRVLKMLVNVQTSGEMPKSEMHFYLNAAMTGRKAKFAGDCSQCMTTFPACFSSSTDLIDLASLLRINH